MPARPRKNITRLRRGEVDPSPVDLSGSPRWCWEHSSPSSS